MRVLTVTVDCSAIVSAFRWLGHMCRRRVDSFYHIGTASSGHPASLTRPPIQIATDGTFDLPYQVTVKHTPVSQEFEMHNVSDDPMELEESLQRRSTFILTEPTGTAAAATAVRQALGSFQWQCAGPTALPVIAALRSDRFISV
jgi:hypothetical protein